MSGLSAHVVVRRPELTVDVGIDVAEGQTVAVMGPSGAGKSTLLGALAGLVPLTEGEVAVDGQVVERTRGSRIRLAPMHRGIVLLGQDPRLFPHLSARENVAFGPRAGGMARAAARAQADAWLERVGLADAGDRRPAHLSGGQQQRVAVARALAASPRAVLLDEPLVALDPVTAGDIRAMLAEQLAHTTVVAVTHDAVDAAALADRLVVIEAGEVRQSGAVADVLGHPATGFVAAIAGLNRVEGIADRGAWAREDVRLVAADAASRRLASADGRALAAVFRPAAVRVGAAAAPGGWVARVDRLESTPAGVRVHAGWCVADVDAAAAAGLRPGASVPMSLDPADVRFIPASAAAARLGA
ncbi:ATP-binding cassette domain-containing protein [Microbacterium lushaniae]|uniref:ATP-binding cassette domain-containing protein n=1 Tax=Microbacterium lushaniae TaxID=2614639 RepID=UPI001781269C|nr:ATP-binding cassette domain-containing protein [Microbacterium lushaniae]